MPVTWMIGDRESMSVIRLNLMSEFYFGDDAVLLAMDGSGVDELRGALSETARTGHVVRAYGGITHEFTMTTAAADIDLTANRVCWRLDPTKAAEIIDHLTVLSTPREGGNTAGHFYVDLHAPAETLVVSRDEYVRFSAKSH